MKKSLITASVLGVIGAAISGVAFADNSMTSTYCKPGFYAGLQAGEGNTFYSANDLLTQAATQGSGLTTSSLYTTGSPTVTTTTYGSTQLSGQNVDNSGWAGRLYAGYQFNPYFALETGYTQFNKTTATANGLTTTVSTTASNTVPSNTYDITKQANYFTSELTQHAIDLVAKGTLPLQYGFGLYAKAGLAYEASNRYINQVAGNTVVNNVSYPGAVYNNSTITNNGTASQNTMYEKSYQNVAPTYGAGIDYTIPCSNVDVEVFYNRIEGNGGFSPSSLWGMGVGYKFA